MILYNTPYQDMYRIMDSECEKVEFAIRKADEKAKKIWRASSDRPLVYNTIYTNPDTNNHYLIWFYSNEKRGENHMAYLWGSALMLTDDKGKKIYVAKNIIYKKAEGETYKTDIMQVFTGHFFSRYRERICVPDRYNEKDLISIYFGRNTEYAIEIPPYMITKKLDKYEGTKSWQVYDGILLGYDDTIEVDGKPIIISKVNTFLSESILKPEQSRWVAPAEMLKTKLKMDAKDIPEALLTK